METIVTLSEHHVRLRTCQMEHCTANYVEWLNNPNVNRYLETRYSEQNLQSISEFVRSMLISKNDYLFAILENHTEKHIGNIKLGPINWVHRFAELSYFIGDTASWGKGYASEAIKLAIQFGFEQLGLLKIQAGVYGTNMASIRALEKNGFVLEGVLRSKFEGLEGREDHLIFGLHQQ